MCTSSAICHRLIWNDVGVDLLDALGMSFAATLYPALPGHREREPAEALRYD